MPASRAVGPRIARKLVVVFHVSFDSSSRHSLEHPVKRLAPHCPSAQTAPYVPLEPFPIDLQVLCRLLIERVTRVWLEKQELQSNNHRVQVQHRFPILPQDVQAHVALEVDVRVVDLLRAFDLGRVVGEVLIDRKAEVEAAAFVHSLVRVDGECEVEDVVGVCKVCFHRCTEGKLFEICTNL